uniref:Uncharacterized protein n=1 Tax=Globodera rostochiensis TaxID=31243 RepID=A0A914HWJ1_GLORO
MTDASAYVLDKLKNIRAGTYTPLLPVCQTLSGASVWATPALGLLRYKPQRQMCFVVGDGTGGWLRSHNYASSEDHLRGERATTWFLTVGSVDVIIGRKIGRKSQGAKRLQLLAATKNGRRKVSQKPDVSSNAFPVVALSITSRDVNMKRGGVKKRTNTLEKIDEIISISSSPYLNPFKADNEARNRNMGHWQRLFAAAAFKKSCPVSPADQLPDEFPANTTTTVSF